MAENDKYPLADAPAPARLRPSGRPSPRFSDERLAEMRLGFLRRLREAFDHAPNAEIARRLDTTDATIKFWMDNERMPTLEMLWRISSATGVDMHWLLTGQGDRRF
jgi:transcriptional regulator with XRE-family HTH domain